MVNNLEGTPVKFLNKLNYTTYVSGLKEDNEIKLGTIDSREKKLFNNKSTRLSNFQPNVILELKSIPGWE
jgi:hypothetical protein